jgi:riboflavin biosynthesis pyrimidine reductase
VVTSAPPLETLYEVPDLPSFDLPAALEAVYGRFGLADDVVIANFVSSIDGVIAIPGIPASSPVISGGNPADRFVVALLRAAADAVVIGASTYRAHSGPWTADRAFPDLGPAFDELRTKLGLDAAPTLVVVTRSGSIGEPRPLLRGAIIASTSWGKPSLERLDEAGAVVLELGEESVHAADLFAELRARGLRRILTEGGPDLMGRFLEGDAVDELFLTVAPVLLGGGDPAPPTLGGRSNLRAGLDRRGRLASLRRGGDLLFLRYGLRQTIGPVSAGSP